MLRVAAALLLPSLLACTPSEPQALAGRHVGKRELYGDAALVPTREGERVRRELMLAGELERLLERAGIGAGVEVSLRGPGQALVIARTDDEARVRAIARAGLPDDEVGTIEVVLVAASPEPTPRRSSLPLVLVALALGVSLGVAGERARGRGMLRVRGMSRH